MRKVFGFRIPAIDHKVRTSIALLALAAITSVGIVACASSGSATIKGEQMIQGTAVRFKAKLKWGPAEPQPPGANVECYLSIGGDTYEIWEVPEVPATPPSPGNPGGTPRQPKRQWFHEPNTTEWNQIIGGTFTCLGTRGDGGDDQEGPGMFGEFSSPGFFYIDTDVDTSALSFDLPPRSIVIDPARPAPGERPINVIVSATPQPGGATHLNVSGSLNEVAMWALFQRIHSFETSIRTVGKVTVTVNSELSLIVITDAEGNLVPASEDFRPVRPIVWDPLQ